MKPKTVLPVLLAKKPVVVRQAAAIFGHFPDEGVALLVIVMEMHFHVADAQTHHLRYAVEQSRRYSSCG
jgi:hypothetical protein